MGIYIRGMEMPKDCPYCPMSHWNKRDEFTGCDIVSGKKYTLFNDKEYANSSTRPDWCPLIKIPDKHGRLIDADEMFEEFVIEGQRSKRYKIGEKWELNGEEIRGVISRLPTIIPAEEGE